MQESNHCKVATVCRSAVINVEFACRVQSLLAGAEVELGRRGRRWTSCRRLAAVLSDFALPR